MAQAVSCRLFTAKNPVRSQVFSCEICGGQNGTVTGFSPSNSVFPCQYHSTNTPYSSSSTCCSYQKDKRAKLENFENAMAFGNRGAVDRKHLIFVLYVPFIDYNLFIIIILVNLSLCI
jgi:hypothetical protein